MSFNTQSFLNFRPKKSPQDSSLSTAVDSDLVEPDSVHSDAPTDELDQLEAQADSTSHQSNSSTVVAAILKLLPLSISVFSMLYLFHLGGQIDSIRNDHNQVLVQTVNGRSILAEPVDNYIRTPATVERTVKLWTDLSFNWVQKLPSGEKDQGRLIAGKTFPTRLVLATTLMSPEMAQLWYQVFLQREDYLPSNFLSRDATRVFYPLLQTQPRAPLDSQTGRAIPNRYEVEEHGDWIEYSSQTPQGKLIDRLHILVQLRPVVKTELPLSDDADALQRAAYELRANGLEIYNIKRIKNVP